MRTQLSKEVLDGIGRIITEIAVEEGVSEAHVRESIEEAIRAGMSNPDPKVQTVWDRIPRAGAVPTPEEFIAWGAFIASTGQEP